MKILFLGLNVSGGISQYTSQLANALAKEHEVITIINSKSSDKLYSNEVKTIKFTTKKLFKLPSLISYYKLNKIIKGINPDIIHDTVGPAFYWTTGLLKIIKNNFSLAITIHDPNPHSGMKYPFQELITKHNINMADQIFVHGNNSKNEIISLGGNEKKVEVIPHGTFNFFDKGKTNIREENSVLFFGKMRPNKGIDRLYEISKLVNDQLPKVRFIVAGSIGGVSKHINKNKIKKIINELKSEENFEVHDRYIKNEEVETFFRRASIVLLPYHDATQSGIIPIAYHFKKPVVSTDVGDLDEVVSDGETGFLAHSNSNKEIADLIVKLINNQDLKKKMGEAAYNYSQEHLSYNEIAKKIEKFYYKILN